MTTGGWSVGETSGLEEVRTMLWETPVFTEVKMDAEMTSYQDDLEGV